MKTPDLGKAKIGKARVEVAKIKGVRLPDPNDNMEQIDDLTTNAGEEIGEQLQKIKAFEKKFEEHWQFEGDSNYYFAIVFKSKKERDAFLAKHGVELECDNYVVFEEIERIFKEG